jgi:hypothetical protein
MNKPLAVAIACFLSATMLTLALPAQESEAGFRRHCYGRAARTRCCGRHIHRARCHGNYGVRVYYDSGFSHCCGTYQHGCNGGAQHGVQADEYNEVYTPDQLPPAPQEGSSSSSSPNIEESAAETTSPSDSNNPPPPLTP